MYIALFVLLISCSSSQYVTGRGSFDLSDDLNLEAVAYLFGESENLRQFERKLNDPGFRISNLDLNGDGYVDYLRVIDASNRGVYLVVVQAVLGRNIFQDVATITIGRDMTGMPVVEVAGDPYLYGSNYIFVPQYARSPVIVSFFWGPQYRPWYSPYYWGHYPSYYVHRRPWPAYRYHAYIHRHNYRPHSCHYSGMRKISVPDYARRNDYGARRPQDSFNNRNQGVQNKEELNRRRLEAPGPELRPSSARRSAGQPVRVPEAVPSSQRSGSKQETTPARRERTAPSRVSPDSKPTQEQRGTPAKSGSDRRSGTKVNSSSTQKTSATRASEKKTVSPSRRTESTSRRQTTTRSQKATTQPTKSRSETTKSRSETTTSGSGRR